MSTSSSSRPPRYTEWSTPTALLSNTLLALAVFAMCRLVFFAENYATYAAHFAQWEWSKMGEGALRFDGAAVAYTQLLYALILVFPFHRWEGVARQRLAKWYFVGVQSLCVLLNLVDAVYVQYTGRRTTSAVFQEFANEGNIGRIFWAEVLPHFYLFVVGALLVFLIHRCYRPAVVPKEKSALCNYYLSRIGTLLLFALIAVVGMRGGYVGGERPIRLTDANVFVKRPTEASLILNTPFSFIRTLGKRSFVVPDYFPSDRVAQLYSPLHEVGDARPMRRKNVVVLIVESMGREYIGALNRDLDGGRYRGFTPFLDSLCQQSYRFQQSYATGRKSIDGMPSVLSSLPMMGESIFLTSAALNKMSGLAGELRQEGYTTAFFHGAETGSMGFLPFSRTTGFAHYFGWEDYEADPVWGKKEAFDGTWGIWDEWFLQYYAHKMTHLRPPFMTTVFTLSSHHPFHVPEAYAKRFPEQGGHPLYKCISYADYALRRFFETARRQPWYNNTIFVLTADHTNAPIHDEYRTVAGLHSVPIFFFDPSGELPPTLRQGIAQQPDIMPTVLSYLGYKRPFVAFGHDLLHTPDAETWTAGWDNGTYYIIRGTYLLLFDGERTTAIYNMADDRLCKQNLVGKVREQSALETLLKAYIQSYMERINSNQLVCD